MSCVEINLEWPRKMYAINELHDFFNSPNSYHSNSVYIYFWIYSDSNIRYIGESKQMKDRIHKHIINMIHGKYAVTNDTDMKDFHKNWNNEKFDKDRPVVARNNGKVSYFNDKYFLNKKIDFVELKSSIETIISTSINNIKKMKFIFAKMNTNENKVDSKDCESLFMLNLMDQYNNPPVMTKSNDLYFGHISKYPPDGVYKIKNDFSSSDCKVKECLEKCGLVEMVFDEVKIQIENKKIKKIEQIVS